MKTTTTTLLAGTMLMAAAGSPAFAQNNGQNTQNRSSQQNSHMQGQHKQGQHNNAGGSFDGKIMSLRTIKFNNGKKYVLAKIKGSQGQTAVLNLGTKKNLTDQNADVKKGQQIHANGRSGRINDKPVVVVYSFKTDSQNGATDSSQ